MSLAAIEPESGTPQPLALLLEPVIQVSDRQLFEICRINRELRIERNAAGEILIMTPTGGQTSERNSEINHQLRTWAKEDKTGKVFDSSGGFILPNGALRSPDAAWVRSTRLADLDDQEKHGFIPLCPDLVIELRSPSDRVSVLQTKMQEYIDNGAVLGWMLDPGKKRVYEYRPGNPMTVLEGPEHITAGDPVLNGLILDLREVWDTGW